MRPFSKARRVNSPASAGRAPAAKHSASAFRATGVGGPSKFLDHTVQEGGTLYYFDAASGKWVETPLAEGKYASPVVVIELASGASYFLALPRTKTTPRNTCRRWTARSTSQRRRTASI